MCGAIGVHHEPIDASGPLVHDGDDRFRAVTTGVRAERAMSQTQSGSAIGKKTNTGTRPSVSARAQSADRLRAHKKMRVPRPTHTPAAAPSRAHLRVLISSAVCSVYQRL